MQKKARDLPSRSRSIEQPSGHHNSETLKINDPLSSASQSHFKPKSEQHNILKSILKKPKSQTVPDSKSRQLRSLSPSPSLPPNLSKGTKDRLRADDAEIEALEKALGLKGTKSLPKSFTEDGLDILLEGIEGSGGKTEALKTKRKRTEEEDWLERKRGKARGEVNSDLKAEVEVLQTERNEDWSDGSSTEDGLSGSGEYDEADTLEFSREKSSSPEPQSRKPRENPYKAPIVTSDSAVPSKYIPPSLRAEDTSPAQDLSSLRRQLQGLLNRLSEANLLSVLGEVEKLYQVNARQHVSATLLDLLIGLLCDPTSLQDTFIILHAGFIAAIYKVIGTDFGAQTIQRIDQEFTECYSSEVKVDSTSKRSANLISLIAEMYNFQVIGSNLIYDFIRLFLEDLSETSTELIMKIMRSKYSFWFRPNSQRNFHS